MGKKNDKLAKQKEQLFGRYKKEYLVLENQILFGDRKYSDISKYECLEEILDIMLEAQDNNLDPDIFIGKNKKAFCKNLLNSKDTLSVVDNTREVVINMCIVATVLAICYTVIFGGKNVDGIFIMEGNKINMFYPIFASISVFFVDYLTRRFMRASLNSNKNSFLVVISAVIQLILTVVCFALLYQAERFIKPNITLPIWAAVMFFLFIIAMVKFVTKVYRRIKYKNVEKYKIKLADDDTPFRIDFRIHGKDAIKKDHIRRYYVKHEKYEQQDVYYPFEDYVFSKKRKTQADNKSEFSLLLLLGVVEVFFATMILEDKYALQMEKSEVRFMFFVVLAGIFVGIVGIIINFINLSALKDLQELSQEEIDEMISKANYNKDIEKEMTLSIEEKEVVQEYEKTKAEEVVEQEEQEQEEQKEIEQEEQEQEEQSQKEIEQEEQEEQKEIEQEEQSQKEIEQEEQSQKEIEQEE